MLMIIMKIVSLFYIYLAISGKVNVLRNKQGTFISKIGGNF